MVMQTAVDEVDLTDVDLFLRGEQFTVFKLLREQDPVHWNERSWGQGFWNITKYQDVINVGIDPATFISSKGIILDNDGRRTAREKALAATQGAALFEPRGNMMIMTDPPRHSMLRRMVNKAFTHKAVRRMEPHIHGLVTKIIDDICERGECDFVRDVARLLPLEVICEMVGVPEGDWESMFELTNQILGGDDPEFMPDHDDIREEDVKLSFELFTYMQELISDRRQTPRDDVLTVLVQGDVDGQHLNDGEIFMFFLLLILAGNETTRQATAGGMLALIENLARDEQDKRMPSTRELARLGVRPKSRPRKSA